MEPELALVRPELTLCLGATAAQSVMGMSIRVTEERGRRLPTAVGAEALITVHPSARLRLPPGADAAVEFDRFVADLRSARTS